jgi:hypothetical protein
MLERNEDEELQRSIREMTDEELLRMVVTGRRTSNWSTLNSAHAELERRGFGPEEIEGHARAEGEPATSEETASPEVQYKIFRSSLSTWDTLFSDAAAFASRLGPGKVISISHSESNGDGVVTVWYWSV